MLELLSCATTACTAIAKCACAATSRLCAAEARAQREPKGRAKARTDGAGERPNETANDGTSRAGKSTGSEHTVTTSSGIPGT